jgi:uncharacterized protein (DUF342 family)
MTRHTRHIIGAMAVLALAVLGCNRRDDVRQEVQDLHEAEQAAPKKAQELQQQLDDAKTHVAQLEQKLTLARQGVTDDVLRARQELKSAVKQDEHRVNEEVQQAQGAANQHNQDLQKAQKAREQTQPAGRVETEVKTETHVVPTDKNTGVVHERQAVPIDRTRMVEEQKQQPQQPQQPQQRNP